MSRHEHLTNKAEIFGTSDMVTEAATHMMWGHGAYDMIIMGTLGDTGDDCRHPQEDVYSAQCQHEWSQTGYLCLSWARVTWVGQTSKAPPCPGLVTRCTMCGAWHGLMSVDTGDT